MDYTTPVVVLGVHYGSLGIARSLGRLGVPVHGVHGNLGIPEFASRYFAGRHRWDFEQAAPASSIEFLLDLRTKFDRDAILVPTTDDTAQLLADHSATLRSGYRFQDNSPALVRGLRRKWELCTMAQHHGVPVPATLLPRSVREAVQLADRIGFPLMLKSSDGARLGARALPKMVVVRTERELMDNFARLEDPSDDSNLMLQEYIPGGDDDVWMFNGYFDPRSHCVAGFTGKKLRQHPVGTGATSLGICSRNDVVHQLMSRFLGEIAYQGIIDIGLRYDARDGQYKLLDVNPRIGATFRLFVGADGTDVVRLLYLDLTGAPLPVTEPVEGRKWLDERRDMYTSRECWRRGSLTFATWLRSFGGVRETAWFALDDPIPFLRMAATLTMDAIRKVYRNAARLIGQAN